MMKVKLIRNRDTLEIDCILKAHAAGSTLYTIAIKKSSQDKWIEIGDISFHKKAKQQIFIEDVYIEKDHQLQGFGRLLIQKLQSKYNKISLFSTRTAETFWRKMDFVHDSESTMQDEMKLIWSKKH